MKCETSLESFFYGTATVGDRGQVVIPADARKKLNINPGDKMLVLGHPSKHGVVLCKIDAMRDLVGEFMERLESAAAEDNDQREVHD